MYVYIYIYIYITLYYIIYYVYVLCVCYVGKSHDILDMTYFVPQEYFCWLQEGLSLFCFIFFYFLEYLICNIIMMSTTFFFDFLNINMLYKINLNFETRR